jgi:osmoprotectant transport system substrate-binding protein
MTVRRPHATWSALLLAIATVAVAGLSACGGGDDTTTTAAKTTPANPAGSPIRIGTKDFTEEFLLGELYSQALEANGFDVRLKSNIGSSELTHRALGNKRLDMYPEYVGTLLSEVWDVTERPASPTAAYDKAKGLEESRGYTLLAPTPFSDSEALAVTPAFARRHNVDSIADLRRMAKTLTIGAPSEFGARFEGLNGLKKVYAIDKPGFKPLDFDKRYPSLDSGAVDVAAVFTTERQLAGSRYIVLKDPEGLFAIQHVAPIINKAVLAAHGPRLAQVIDAVSAKLTTTAMRKMNGAVDLDGRKPREVAAEFLRSQALV